MGFQPTNNAVGVAFYLSGCLKTFCPLRWAGMPPYNDTWRCRGGSKTHPTAVFIFRLPESVFTTIALIQPQSSSKLR
ncbi:MAG: hypothetical protein IKX14_01775 [Neisseriaceae bacterium]|nr:hypothetical protein [Neisseriaceae bacterium]